MFFSKLTLSVLLSATVAGLAAASTLDDIVAAPILAYRDPQQNKAGKGKAATSQAATPASAAKPAAPAAAGANNAGAAASLTLNANAIQTGSALNGQEAGADPAQVPSATDNANFINFCSGQVLTNGLQIKTGSCNGIPMGKIPAVTNMIAGIILFPQNGQDLTVNKTFAIQVQINHLSAGHFTNPKSTYYSAPQDLDQNGDIIGHTHITVQDMGSSLNPTTPPDPQKFAFFKGVNDAGNGKGLLSATVLGGLPAGNYRVCTMTAARNHQPVNMPVAQRGSQDDCTKFTVGLGGAATGGAGGAGTGAGTGAGKGAGAGGAATGTSAATGAATGTGTGAGKGAGAGGAGAGGAGTGAGAGAGAGGALDLGSCSNPNIEFGVGFDGRKEGSFQPVNKGQFNHGSAQNIDIITSFICDRIRDTCRAPQATQDQCTAAKNAPKGLTGQAAADAWNKAFPAKGKRDVIPKRAKFAERAFTA